MQKLLHIFILLFFCNIYLNSQIKDEKIANKTEITQRLQTNQFYFLENKGQWDDKVLFMAQSKSLRTWITKNSIVFEQFEKQGLGDRDRGSDFDKFEPKPIKAHAVGLEFMNPSLVNAMKGEAGSTKFNFIIGNDKSKHKSGVLQYSEVSIENIYEGIDMRYYFDNGELRYDFIVKPGANPDLIEMEIKGSDNFYIKDGDVVMETSLEPVTQKGLNAYQDKKQKKVDCKFKIKGNKLKFELGDYDKGKELVIDPLTDIIESEFPGDGPDHYIVDLAITPNGDIIFMGQTNGTVPGASARIGPYRLEQDILLGKIDENLNLNSIEWMTYLGGQGNDWGKSLAVDVDYIYIYGITTSKGFDRFPVTSDRNFFQNVEENQDCFFSVTNHSGIGLVYSTLLIGYNSTTHGGLKVSNDGDIYLIGEVIYDLRFQNLNEITKQNLCGQYCQHGFILGLHPITNNYGLNYERIFQTYFGGDGETWLYDIDIDINENMYICGETNSTSVDRNDNSFYTTTDAFHETSLGTYWTSGYVAKLRFDEEEDEVIIDYNTFFPPSSDAFYPYVTNILFNDNKMIFSGYSDISYLPLKNGFHDGTGLNFLAYPYIAAIEPNSTGFSDLKYAGFIPLEWVNELPIIDIDYDETCNKLIVLGVNNDEEITGFTHLISPLFEENITTNFVAVIDINETGPESMTELGYFPNTLNAIKVKQGTNYIYMGGSTENNFYLEEISKTYCTEEPCECPGSITRNSWLNLELATTGNDCPDNQCKVQSTFAIDEGYECYYGYNVYVNGAYTPDFFTNTTDVENFINRCIPKGESLTITIDMIEYPGDQTPCTITKSIECPCSCPGNVNSWLTISTERGGLGCNPDQCKVSYEWNIPAGYDCFTHYKQDNELGAVYEMSSSPYVTLPNCIEKGENIDVTIALMQSVNESWEDACKIEVSDVCNVVEGECPSPCYPNCYNDDWNLMPEKTVELTDCPGCWIKYCYWARNGCPEQFGGTQDIQITRIIKYNKYNDPDLNCDDCTDKDVYEQAVEDAIAQNVMGFEPDEQGDPCSIAYRISKASCWVTWEEYEFDWTHGISKKFTIYAPCNESCCLRALEVCREGPTAVTITDLGILNVADNCENVFYYRELPPPPEQIPCEYTCDMLDSFYTEYFGKSPEIEKEIIDDYFLKDDEKRHLQLNVSSDDNWLNVFVQESDASHISISVYDLRGNLILSRSGGLTKGLNNYSINVSKLNSGIYIYNVVIDDILFKTDKLNIVR